MASERPRPLKLMSPSREDPSKGKGVATPQVVKKKVEISSGGGVKLYASDSKFKGVSSVSKSVEVKGKTSSSSSKTITNKATARGRAQKKVFSLVGQKYDTPEEREPLRIFYESLSKQIPSSEMAEFWLMEHGMLSPERAKKAYEKKQRRQQQQRNGTPVKTVTFERPESSKKPVKVERPDNLKKPAPMPMKNGDIKAKKRITMSSDDDDDDFLVNRMKKR